MRAALALGCEGFVCLRRDDALFGKLVGAVVAGAVVIAGFSAVAGAVSGGNDREGVVERVVDGDTLEARVAGRTTTIRLLNVDSPETKHPDRPVECLGQEASEFLAARLPAGTKVRLEYDVDRLDRYGRTLAGVYQAEKLVNAEIAERGLGVAVTIEPNRRFFAEVQAAQERAQAEGKGFYDPLIGCTAAALMKQTAAQYGTPPDAAEPTTAAEAALTIAALERFVDEGNVALRLLTYALDGTGSLAASPYREVRSDYLNEAGRGVTAARELKSKAEARRTQLAAQEEAARAAAEEAPKAEEARLADEARKAEEARRAAAEEQARLEASRRSTSTTTSRPKPATTTTTKAPANPYPGYTGPRCYAPGGKTWKPC